MGLSIEDDSTFLSYGMRVERSSFIFQQEWSPLYSAWFKFLALFCPNPLWRYFLSWGLLVTFATMIPFWMKMPRAWVYAFFMLCFPFLTVNPFVSLFAAVIILLSLCLVLRRRPSVSGAMGVACATCFVVGFCRPEFDYGVLLAATGTVVALILERQSLNFSAIAGARVPGKWHAIAIGFGVACLSGAMLYVMAHGIHNRSGMAFAQHYSYRASERGLIPADGAWSSDYTEKTFGVDTIHTATTGTATLGDFVRARPGLFLQHVLRNILDYRTIVFLLPVFGVMLWPWFREDLRFLRPAAAFLFVLCVPPLVDIVAIYPRDHYPILVLPALVLFAMQLILPLWRLKPIPWLLGPGCVLIWWVMLHRHNPSVPGSRFAREWIDLHRVQCARSVDQSVTPAKPTIFDTGSVPIVYLVHTRTRTTPSMLPSWAQFKDWTASVRPAWISTDMDLATRYQVTYAQLDQFVRDDLGYTPHVCPAEAKLTIYTAGNP